MVIDLNAWHRGLHMVTGSIFNRATPADLEKWAGMLREIAAEMTPRKASTEKKICLSIDAWQVVVDR
jgi:hypothetical protein